MTAKEALTTLAQTVEMFNNTGTDWQRRGTLYFISLGLIQKISTLPKDEELDDYLEKTIREKFFVVKPTLNGA